MIDITKLSESDKGRGVVYTHNNGATSEDGTITSWNDRYIFVCYDHTGRGQATPPEKLEFLFNPQSK